MKARFLETTEKYDGTQLVSLSNYLRHGLLGDSIVAWIGPCDVGFEHMVDGEDLLAEARISGSKMLHFIVEKFDHSLFTAVVLQRLFAGIVRDQIQILSPDEQLAPTLVRAGDDLFSRDRKLSISVATQSPVSSLIHFAVNISNHGTPVKTLSLEDLKVDAKALANEVMRLFCGEIEDMQQAAQKVRWVR